LPELGTQRNQVRDEPVHWVDPGGSTVQAQGDEFDDGVVVIVVLDAGKPAGEEVTQPVYVDVDVPPEHAACAIRGAQARDQR
jgi:hypothetical protein